jgi:hypothetical protein
LTFTDKKKDCFVFGESAKDFQSLNLLQEVDTAEEGVFRKMAFSTDSLALPKA